MVDLAAAITALAVQSAISVVHSTRTAVVAAPLMAAPDRSTAASMASADRHEMQSAVSEALGAVLTSVEDTVHLAAKAARLAPAHAPSAVAVAEDRLAAVVVPSAAVAAPLAEAVAADNT